MYVCAVAATWGWKTRLGLAAGLSPPVRELALAASETAANLITPVVGPST